MTERLTIPEIIDRLAKIYQDENLRVLPEALRKRMKRRREEVGGEVTASLSSFPDAASLSDEDILAWLRTHIYIHLRAAINSQDVNEARKTTDVFLRVLKAKKDLVGADDSDKEAEAFLKTIRRGFGDAKPLN